MECSVCKTAYISLIVVSMVRKSPLKSMITSVFVFIVIIGIKGIEMLKKIPWWPKMKKRLIVRTSDQPKGKGIVLQEDDTIETLKNRIQNTIFPELKDVRSNFLFAVWNCLLCHLIIFEPILFYFIPGRHIFRKQRRRISRPWLFSSSRRSSSRRQNWSICLQEYGPFVPRRMDQPQRWRHQIPDLPFDVGNECWPDWNACKSKT